MSQPRNFPDVAPISDSFVRQVESSLSALVPAQSSTILLALSGGPDSCALLAALKALAGTGGFRLVACHVNHGLRGAESDADESFCVDLCRHWQVDLEVTRLTGTDKSEAALREGRYAALVDDAEKRGASCIATAHTLDDQVETVLFRLFRGSAPGGLVSMAPARQLSPATTLIRPMLDCRREDVLSFLERMQLQAREDSSNQSTEYGRNYIRSVIVPHIRERFPTFQSAIERMRTLLQEDELLIDGMAEAAREQIEQTPDQWSLQELLTQPLSIRRRLVADALRSRDIEVTFERAHAVLELLGKRQGALALNQYWQARIEDRWLQWRFVPDADEETTVDKSAEIQLQVPGLTVSAELCVAVQIDELATGTAGRGFPPASSDEALVDLQRAAMPLVVRVRRPGDVIQPFGMEQQVRLKKYLHTHKTGADINFWRAIVIADSREVLWVPGVGISEKLRVSGKPTHHLRFMHLDPEL